MDDLFDGVLEVVKEGFNEKPVETLLAVVGIVTIFAIVSVAKR